jgi:hypothetical protein
LTSEAAYFGSPGSPSLAHLRGGRCDCRSSLFIALGGSVYAASNKIEGSQIKPKSLPGNRLVPGSVAANQIKKGSIGEAQLKANAVNGKQVKAGAITAGKIQGGTITGTQIKSGSLGAAQINQTTLTGISAANIDTVQYVNSTVTLVPKSATGTSTTASCPSGMKVVGGGAALSSKEFGSVLESSPNSERSGWYANGFLGSNQSVTMYVTAICTAVASPAG